MHDEAFLTEQAIHERRLADIRLADDRDLEPVTDDLPASSIVEGAAQIAMQLPSDFFRLSHCAISNVPLIREVDRRFAQRLRSNDATAPTLGNHSKRQ